MERKDAPFGPRVIKAGGGRRVLCRSPDSLQRRAGRSEPEESESQSESSQLHVFLNPKAKLAAVPCVAPKSFSQKTRFVGDGDAAPARKHAGAEEEAAADRAGRSLRLCR